VKHFYVMSFLVIQDASFLKYRAEKPTDRQTDRQSNGGKKNPTPTIAVGMVTTLSSRLTAS